MGLKHSGVAALMIALGLPLAGCSSAAQLSPGCTVPALSNAGTCGSFVAGEALTVPVVQRFRWYNADAPGPVSQDSIPGAVPGSFVRLSPRTVPVGRYWVVSWATLFGAAGCQDSALVVATATPAKPTGIVGQ